VSSTGSTYNLLLPSELGSSNYAAPNFQINIDIRSLTIAYAIMTGILKFDDLSYVQSLSGVSTYIHRRDVIHPDFPGKIITHTLKKKNDV